jgi:hypothetical protein
MKTNWTLALDLEGTLISNAVSQFPRPGLRAFLDWAGETFERVVFYSAVDEPLGREILARLVDEGDAPEWVNEAGYYEAVDGQKDLRRVCETGRVLLVDDYPGYAVPGQEVQLVVCQQMTMSLTDNGLAEVRAEIERRIERSGR